MKSIIPNTLGFRVPILLMICCILGIGNPSRPSVAEFNRTKSPLWRFSLRCGFMYKMDLTPFVHQPVFEIPFASPQSVCEEEHTCKVDATCVSRCTPRSGLGKSSTVEQGGASKSLDVPSRSCPRVIQPSLVRHMVGASRDLHSSRDGRG